MAANFETEIDQLASDVENIQLAPGIKDKSSTIKVLSWNIHGSSKAGMAEARKRMLKSVISDVGPHIMLLQETKKGIDGFFEDAGIPKKDYNYEEAKTKEETRVIYKNNAFEKVDPSLVDLDTVLKKMFPEVETKVLDEIIPPTQNPGSEKVPERETIKSEDEAEVLDEIIPPTQNPGSEKVPERETIKSEDEAEVLDEIIPPTQNPGSETVPEREKIKNEDETEVLDEIIPPTQNLGSETVLERETIKNEDETKVLDEIIPPTQNLESETVLERETIKNRICVAHLRLISTKREIIFVSYHNIRHHGENMATKVCEIVERLQESNECYVIAGVDFNCDLENVSFDSKLVEVPSYTTTSRRKKKIDYFILSKSTENWKVEEVRAFDLSPLHKTLESEGFTRDQLNKALDHDPLLLSLSAVKTEGVKEEVEVKEKEENEEEEKKDHGCIINH